jgi:hypothetical protein
LFRWQFANAEHTRNFLKLAARRNAELQAFLETVNLNSLERIPDTYSEVYETGESDVAFRVNVLTGAPVLVGILLEHKSGRDGKVLDQISRYVHSVMKLLDKNRAFGGFPTMAVIFYNGREKWNPLKNIEDGYPEYWRGAVLPFKCVFVNLADIDDEDCLMSEDVSTAMVVLSMKYAYNGQKIIEMLPRFKNKLAFLDYDEASCLLTKVMLYLREYVDENLIEELDMAFRSIGQKYGFVSAGDVSRMREAEARQKGRAEGHNDERVAVALDMLADDEPIEKIVKYSHLSEERVILLRNSQTKSVMK